MANWLVFLIVFTALGSGLVAGVFFAFSSFVMRALEALAMVEGIRAMQRINTAVINPSFVGVFFGTAAACLALLGIAVMQWGERGAAHLLWGSLVYLIGSIGVTMVCHVPLNNALAAVDAQSVDAARVWQQYQRQWTRWNHVRGLAAMISCALFIHPLW